MAITSRKVFGGRSMIDAAGVNFLGLICFKYKINNPITMINEIKQEITPKAGGGVEKLIVIIISIIAGILSLFGYYRIILMITSNPALLDILPVTATLYGLLIITPVIGSVILYLILKALKIKSRAVYYLLYIFSYIATYIIGIFSALRSIT